MEYHQWEPFESYQKEFDHPWWKAMGADLEQYGHGGTDNLELSLFIKAVKDTTWPSYLDLAEVF